MQLQASRVARFGTAATAATAAWVVTAPAVAAPLRPPPPPYPPSVTRVEDPAEAPAQRAVPGEAAKASETEGDGSTPGAAAPPTADVAPEATVIVRGPVLPRRESAAASDFDIEPGQLADVPRRSAQHMLTLAPGIFLSNPGGEGHPSAVFLRGFDAGIGQDLEFTVEGAPINEVSNAHGHGFSDPLFIMPEVVTRLRVIEGPFDPRQGDFAVAGSVNYELGLPFRGVMARGTYGSFNTGRAATLWGPKGHGEKTFVAGDFSTSDGFGVSRAYRSGRLIAGFDHRFGKGFSVDVLAIGYATRFDQAGVVRADDVEARRIEGCDSSFDAQFFCAYDRGLGGASSRFGLMAGISRARHGRTFRQQVFAWRRDLRMRENFTGFITDVRSDGGAQRGDRLEQRYGVTTVGAQGSYGITKDWEERPQSIELGYRMRYDDGVSSAKRLRAADGVPYRVDFDHAFKIADLSLYAAGSARPLSWLDLHAGLRLDTFLFGFVDRNQPEMDRLGEREPSQAADAYGISVQPRASAVFHVLQWPRTRGAGAASQSRGSSRPALGYGGLDLLLAYGMGTRSTDVAALSDGEFAPFARVQAAETGLRVRWDGIADRFGFDARAVAFYTHVDRDLVFDETAGRNEAVGESNRYGVLSVVRAQVHRWLDAQVSFTWAEAHLPPAAAGPFEWSAGPRLPYIPRYVFRGDAALFHDFWIGRQPFDWSLGLGASYIAPRPLPLNAFGSPYALVDLAARLRWRFVEGGIEIRNLGNARYHEYELYYPSSFEGASPRPSMLPELHFAAGAPLTALATITLYFEADGAKKLEARRLERRMRQEHKS